MPIVQGVLGFRAGGGDVLVLGQPPVVEVVQVAVQVAAVSPVVTVDVGTDTVEVVQP